MNSPRTTFNNVEPHHEHLSFITNAAYMLAATSPALSRHLMANLSHVSIEQEIPISSFMSRQYCSSCGSVYLPLSSQVRIMKRRKNKKRNGLVTGQDEGEQEDSKLLPHRKDLHGRDARFIRKIIDKRVHKDDGSGVKMTRNAHVSYLCLVCHTETKLSLPEVPTFKSQVHPETTNSHIHMMNQDAVKPEVSSNAQRTLSKSTTPMTTPTKPSIPQTKSSACASKPVSATNAPATASKKKKKKGKTDLKSLIQSQKQRDSSNRGYQLSDFLNDLE